MVKYLDSPIISNPEQGTRFLQESQFIATEPLGKDGEAGERQVWQAIKAVFAESECLGYWRYPIFSQVGKYRQEPDILIAHRELGLIIIEVKSITIDQIVTINGHRWEYQNFYTSAGNPYQQAENQLFTLLEYCDREPILNCQVTARAIVALPYISQLQWQERGFHQLPTNPPLIFQEHLSDHKLLTAVREQGTGNREQIEELTSKVWEKDFCKNSNKLEEVIYLATPIIQAPYLTDSQWQLLLAILAGTPVHCPPTRRVLTSSQTRGSIINRLRSHITQIDYNYERIGKQIPPGAQRIRGVAGSGKTVLLCQKAAHMHLKYPQWHIALVFFSRSLYQLIIDQVDQWLRRFSNNQVTYNPRNRNLRIFHSWGGKKQPGLYSFLCQQAGVKHLSANQTSSKQPHQALGEVCTHLLKTAPIPQIFDAILIDEGQDLLVDDEFKFGDKQPFYWLAYQALRAVNPLHPEQRRLIWAYDEAQSLTTLKIPTASELLGEDLGHLVTGNYSDGIKKTEVLHHCYRTPPQILTVAHAMGMGWLRRGGMLTGMTRKEDWEGLGYQYKVTDSYLQLQEVQPSKSIRLKDSAKQITLKRLPVKEAHPLSQCWEDDLIEFQVYSSRQQELTALATNIFHNLKLDGLRPSREMLVIILGTTFAAKQLETTVAEFLLHHGLDIYLPGRGDCNFLEVDRNNYHPNQFWCEGAVTVSRIHRAQGHEADLVYVVGLDNVAKDESNLYLRNQLLVALTRAKGWVNISGIGNYPFYREMQGVLGSGDTVNFAFPRHLIREIGVSDAGELLRRYQLGGRNFQRVDLQNVQLAGANLCGANLLQAILTNANLRDARLDGAKLVIADLSGANLARASLQKAKLMGANLQGVNLCGANLYRANLSDVDLSGANLKGANLTEAILPESDRLLLELREQG